MVQINFALKEISCKIVYYGPGLSGKTTNIEQVYRKAPDTSRGNLTSIATEGDRTLFFDFLPIDLGSVGGMRTKFQLYTVPGQVFYNATRRLVLGGADGVIFVADSSPDKMEENIESLQNLEENLRSYGVKLEETPLVIQYNKRDLQNAVTVEVMNEKLNKRGVPHFESVAMKGDGVFPTLKALAQMMLENLNKKRVVAGAPAEPAPLAAGAPATATAAAKPEEAPSRSEAPSAAPSKPEPAPASTSARRDADARSAPSTYKPARRRVSAAPLPKTRGDFVRRAITGKALRKKKSSVAFWIFVALGVGLILSLLIYIVTRA